MTGVVLALAATGFGIGIALAGAPGPVQAVLVAEAVRGGVPRGLRALAGASATFGALVLALALGASLVPPSGSLLHGLKAAGGAFLLWMAWDGLRTGARVPGEPDRRRTPLPPAARGAMAIVLNPGAWLFLSAVAAPLVAAGAANGGVAPALLVAVALVSGAAAGDAAVVVLGGLGARRVGRGAPARWVAWVPAGVLAALGAWLLVHGLMSLVPLHS